MGFEWLSVDTPSILGSDATQASIILSSPHAPAVLGTISITSHNPYHVSFTPASPASGVTVDTLPVSADSSVSLRTDETPGSVPSLLRFSDSLSLLVIVRNNLPAIRVRDSRAPTLVSFTHLTYFPIDLRFRVPVTYIPREGGPITLKLATAMGYVEDVSSHGFIEFSLPSNNDTQSQQTCRFTLTGDVRKPQQIVFADGTTGKETYGAGRFINIPALLADSGEPLPDVFIDFNQAWNPPCAFTSHATCSRPLKENRLTVRVTAGEQTYEGEH